MANSINQTKKAKYTKKTNTEGVYELYHFETDDKQVLLDEAVGGIAKGTTLHDALTKIKSTAETGGQGAKDLATHIANKNNPHGVTKSQVGLGSVVNAGMDATPTSGSNNYVKSGGVYTAVSEAKSAASAAQSKADSAYSLASGRSSGFVFSDVTGLMSGTKSDKNAISGYKLGDNIYIVATGVADFWISAIGTTGTASTADTIKNAKAGASVVVKWGSSYVTLTAVENKEDLSGYSTTTQIANTYRRKDDSLSASDTRSQISKAKTEAIDELHADINIPGVALAKPIELRPSMTDGGVETLYEGIGWSEQDMTALENAPKWNDDKSIKLWTLSIMPAGGSDDSIDILMGQFYRVGEGISEIGWSGTTVFMIREDEKEYTFRVTVTCTQEMLTETALNVPHVQIWANLLSEGVCPALRDSTTTLQGDVSATFTNEGGTVNATLANSGVTEGTYSCVHVDAKGRVTAGALSLVFASSLDDTESLNNLAEGGVAIIG